MTPHPAVGRLRAALRSTQNRVVLVAIAAAIVAGYYVAWLTDEFAAGFLALVAVGVAVPRIYETERATVDETAWRAARWTVEASALVVFGYLASYEVVRRLSGSPEVAAGVAFVVTWGLAVAVARRVGSGGEVATATNSPPE